MHVLNVRVTGSYEAIDPKTKRTLRRGKSLNTALSLVKGRIFLGNLPVDSDRLRLKVTGDNLIVLNGRAFKEGIDFIRQQNKLVAVNLVNLEDYVKGILYHEASHYWPPEALKAQAIVSRSYALYQAKLNSQKDFDLTNDTYSQVYGGSTSERYRTNKAVEETKGLILIYNSELLPAYYHATCAGRTEDASQIWKINLAPLKGRPCAFCRESPHFKWQAVLGLEELEKKLAAAGYNIGKVEGVSILGRDPSGRITELAIAGEKKETKIAAKDFRNIIGPNIIRSTNFELELAADEAVFEGLGWGHGVGLCQWGAYFMAKQGSSFSEILQFYYPGAEITQLK
jgi:stage II sporulation protein D